jgi:hypothetical protein
MTTFTCALLIINIIVVIFSYFIIRKYEQTVKNYKKDLLNTNISLKNTMMQIDNLNVALDNCKKKKVTKPKVSKDEKKTITK